MKICDRVFFENLIDKKINWKKIIVNIVSIQRLKKTSYNIDDTNVW
jgi:hypothetical protein